VIAFEIALLVFFGVIIVVGIASIGKPITQAYVDKMRYKYKELDSEAETKLKQRVEFLESEVIELKKQLIAVQETAEFAVKQIEMKKD
jgi:hypothetical protein